jgi:undecaprenyl-diphosphatase
MWMIMVAVVQGIVQGITEFVPISSSGHLIIVGNFLHFTGPSAKCFDVFIQLGSILAVVILYQDRFMGLLSFKNPDGTPVQGFRGAREWTLLILTTLPAMVVGLFAYGFIKSHLFRPVTVIMALAAGALAILLVERLKPASKTEDLDHITWRQALAVGLFQCAAMWPGMSRSACTIMGGMLCKINRKAAAEYSFLAAVPTMFAATAYDLYKSRHDLCRADIPYFTVGFIVSMIVAALAMRTFIRLLQRWTLVPFAVYRLVFAGIFAILIIRQVISLPAK